MAGYKKVLGFLLVMLLTYYGVNAGAGPEKNSTAEEKPHSVNGFNETKKDTLTVLKPGDDVVATTGNHLNDLPTALALNEVGKIVVSKDNQRKRQDRKRREDEEANAAEESYAAEDSPGPAPPGPPAPGSGPAPAGGGSGPAPAGGATPASGGGGSGPAPSGDKTTTKAPGSGVSGLFNWQTYILLLTTILSINELHVYLNSHVL